MWSVSLLTTGHEKKCERLCLNENIGNVYAARRMWLWFSPVILPLPFGSLPDSAGLAFAAWQPSFVKSILFVKITEYFHWPSALFLSSSSLYIADRFDSCLSRFRFPGSACWWWRWWFRYAASWDGLWSCRAVRTKRHENPEETNTVVVGRKS